MGDFSENTWNAKEKRSRNHSPGEHGNKAAKGVAHKLIPFMVYLAMWGVIYIGNRHYAQQVELEINDIQEQLQTYRAEYLTMKSELMFKTKQSEVAKMVDSLGLQQLTNPPEKLRVEPAKAHKHEH